MNVSSTRLSVTPIGRTVAQSILHPRSADQLIGFMARRANDLFVLSEDTNSEKALHYSLLHAAYSCDEYSVLGSNRNLPYQLNHLVENPLADEANDFLIEGPWQRNALAANASMLVMRWIEGRARSNLTPEFPRIGSGVIQTMTLQGAEILFAWSDCLLSATGPQLVDCDRPSALGDDRHLHLTLRNLASIIRALGRMVAVGLPGDVVWMAGLMSDDTTAPRRRLLLRSAILELFKNGLTEPGELLRHDTYTKTIESLKPLGLPDLDGLVKNVRKAVCEYRKDQRMKLWWLAIDRAPQNIAAILQDMPEARSTDFEKKVKTLLDVMGIAYEWLDDGRTPGAADLLIGLNQGMPIVMELKTAEGKRAIGLNQATDVIRGAAIVNHSDLPKATLANPGFDPNVLWQARKVKNLALIEASQFAYGISLLAQKEIDEALFFDWLARPGMNPIPISPPIP